MKLSRGTSIDHGNRYLIATETDFVLAGCPPPNTESSFHMNVSSDSSHIDESVMSSYTNRKRTEDVMSMTKASCSSHVAGVVNSEQAGNINNVDLCLAANMVQNVNPT
nr:hypothetical protein [Tanacetum cinerariifolium]